MTLVSNSDKDILRKLGGETAEAAADPVNDLRRELHQKIFNREKCRPSIHIYQEPWSELNDKGELDLYCEDEFCRGLELEMRRELYKWRHYPGDMVISAESVQKPCISDTGFGISQSADVVRTDPSNDVVSSHFHIQIKDEEDIAKIKDPVLSYDSEKTKECFQKRIEIFEGILQVKESKYSNCWWFAPWDKLVELTGVQEILMDMALRPEYVHKVFSRLVDCWNIRLNQYEDLDLLEIPLIEQEASGAAQVFSEVSPDMHREFALEHEARLYKRFNRTYYGCCEPLHAKVDVCAECIPNLFKISMSPWVDFPVAVKNVSDRFIFAWKPNPALVAFEKWDPDLVRNDIREKLSMAIEGGCTVEIHLKDISTVKSEPQRLSEWERIAKEEAERFSI